MKNSDTEKICSGNALLEILIALGISSLIVGALASLAHQSMHAYSRIIKAEADLRFHVRLRTKLQRVLDELDYSILDLPPRVHPVGSLFFGDGTTNPLMQKHGPLALQKQSTALTAVALASWFQFTVLEVKEIAGMVALYACPSGTVLPDAAHGFDGSKFKSFLGIAADGMHELVGTFSFWKPSVQGSCRIFQIKTPPRSMLANTLPPEGAATIRKIIPIDALYTLYLDTQGAYRYLGHVGEKNVENQPLFRSAQSIHCALSPVIGKNLYRLRATVIPRYGKENTFSLLHHLGRHSHLELLFNG